MEKSSFDALHEAYNDVRNDATTTEWAIFTYDGKDIVLGAKGVGYDNFTEHFIDDERIFGFVRLITGDELSKRCKFAFINWVGRNVSPLKKAKMSTDKALVKQAIKSFAVEVVTDEREETEENHIRDLLQKAGGANYGTGTRD